MIAVASQPPGLHTGAGRVILARHATPDWNRRDIPYDIPPGPELTAAGEREALALGEFLRAQGATRVYHSPLERTLRTASLAASVCDAELIESCAIAEWRRNEDEPTVLARVLPLYERAARESAQLGPVVLVTHGGCVLALLTHLGVANAEISHYRGQFDHRNPLPPAGAWLATRRSQSQPWDLRLAFAPNAIQPYEPQLAFV